MFLSEAFTGDVQVGNRMWKDRESARRALYANGVTTPQFRATVEDANIWDQYEQARGSLSTRHALSAWAL